MWEKKKGKKMMSKEEHCHKRTDWMLKNADTPRGYEAREYPSKRSLNNRDGLRARASRVKPPFEFHISRILVPADGWKIERIRRSGSLTYRNNFDDEDDNDNDDADHYHSMTTTTAATTTTTMTTMTTTADDEDNDNDDDDDDDDNHC
uniref:Uncharacterized protein n=1 Tax=Vespula pensylvanica TaxID=30213 RepID=A0A834JP75_VESPE|nr:hypothetical protein H0235_017257 [Vespula pensylvanica]